MFEKEKRQKVNSRSRDKNSSDSSGEESDSSSENDSLTSDQRRQKRLEHELRKRTKKAFKKTQEREQQNRMKVMSKDEKELNINQAGQASSSKFNQDNFDEKSFNLIQTKIVDSIKSESKKKIVQALQALKKAYNLEEDKLDEEQAEQLQEKCQGLDHKLDHQFNDKVGYVQRNLNFMMTTMDPSTNKPRFKDFVDWMFVKQKISYLKLVNPVPRFKEFATQWQNNVDKKKQQRINARQTI